MHRWLLAFLCCVYTGCWAEETPLKSGWIATSPFEPCDDQYNRADLFACRACNFWDYNNDGKISLSEVDFLYRRANKENDGAQEDAPYLDTSLFADVWLKITGLCKTEAAATYADIAALVVDKDAQGNEQFTIGDLKRLLTDMCVADGGDESACASVTTISNDAARTWFKAAYAKHKNDECEAKWNKEHKPKATKTTTTTKP